MGKLYLIATPIGNLEDISIRAIHTLFSVTLLLAEDTRRAGQLMHTLESRFPSLLPTPYSFPSLISYYDEVEMKKIPEIISLLEADSTIGLISDNGTPLISDPGFRLVYECRKRSIEVIAVPGPSAVVTAVSLSGLPTNNFRFIGFLPDKTTSQIKIFQEVKNGPQQTIVAYVSPHKLLQSLETMSKLYGDEYHIVVARELTKIHESIWRGTLRDAHKAFFSPKGEFVLLWQAVKR